jgi:hypothetical protein
MVIADALKVTPAAALTATAAQSVVQTTAGGNLILNAPGSNRLSGKRFSLLASGFASCTAGTFTATIQPILYGDASLATVTTKPLFTAGAGTLAYTGTTGAAIQWTLSCALEGDSTSGQLFGTASSIVGGTLTGSTVTVKPVSTINFQSEPPVKFAIGNTNSATVAPGLKFVVTEFYLDEQ